MRATILFHLSHYRMLVNISQAECFSCFMSIKLCMEALLNRKHKGLEFETYTLV